MGPTIKPPKGHSDTKKSTCQDLLDSVVPQPYSRGRDGSGGWDGEERRHGYDHPTWEEGERRVCWYIERREGDVGCEEENSRGMCARETAETTKIRLFLARSW